LQSTYEAAADLGRWDRPRLERDQQATKADGQAASRSAPTARS
jgi:hypothetical protein